LTKEKVFLLTIRKEARVVDHGKSFTTKRVVLNIILGLKVLPETKMFNYIDANGLRYKHGHECKLHCPRCNLYCFTTVES